VDTQIADVGRLVHRAYFSLLGQRHLQAAEPRPRPAPLLVQKK
jgi:hypothetical protein